MTKDLDAKKIKLLELAARMPGDLMANYDKLISTVSTDAAPASRPPAVKQEAKAGEGSYKPTSKFMPAPLKNEDLDMSFELQQFLLKQMAARAAQAELAKKPKRPVLTEAERYQRRRKYQAKYYKKRKAEGRTQAQYQPKESRIHNDAMLVLAAMIDMYRSSGLNYTLSDALTKAGVKRGYSNYISRYLIKNGYVKKEALPRAIGFVNWHVMKNPDGSDFNPAPKSSTSVPQFLTVKADEKEAFNPALPEPVRSYY